MSDPWGDDPPAPNVVRLKLVKVPKPSVLEHFDETTSDLRDHLKKNPSSGYIVITYRKKHEHDGGGFSSGIDFFLNEPTDRYFLEDFLRVKIRNIADS